MAVRILRRPKAVSDAESIADWIANDSLNAALRFLENVEVTLERLAKFPASGCPLKAENPAFADVRFARVAGFPNHVVFYVEHETAIEVIRILHGAQDIDSELGSR